MEKSITFINKEHIYINEEGIIIPSVSELIRFKFPKQYEGIPETILKNKASYGTSCHKYIEDYLAKKITLKEIEKKKIDPNIKIAVSQIDKLLEGYEIKDMEQIVSYEGRYAGTYDLRTTDDTLIDIKTTRTLHKEWLYWQLGFYQLGANIKKKTHLCLWLPKGKPGELIEVKVATHNECKELLKAYEEKGI